MCHEGIGNESVNKPHSQIFALEDFGRNQHCCAFSIVGFGELGFLLLFELLDVGCAGLNSMN